MAVKYFTRKYLTPAAAYPANLFIFCVVETIVRFVKYAAFPWYKDPLQLTIYPMLTLLYGLLGFTAGMFIVFMTYALPSRKFYKDFQSVLFHMAFCQSLVVFLFCMNFIYEKNLNLKPLSFFAAAVITIVFFYLLNTLLTNKRLHNELWPRFISFSLVADILLIGGVYVYDKMIECLKADIPFSITLHVFAVLASCLVVLFVLKQKPRTKYIFFAGCTLLVLIMSASFFLTASQRSSYPVSLPVEGRPSVILITMDTTRQDHLSCYGYSNKTTPNVDKLAQDGVLFENAHTTSSWTLPAHASLFTGLYPSRHGAYTRERDVFGNDLDAKHITLAEVLSQNDYKTAGFIGGYLCSSFFGLAQGFDYYDENLINLDLEFRNFLLPRMIAAVISFKDLLEKYGFAGKRIAPQINRAVFNWLDKKQSGPFFLFINYFDPHHPYLPINDIFSTPPINKFDSYVQWEKNLINSVLRCRHELTAKEKKHLVERYDREIRQMDSSIGSLIKFLKAKDLYDNTLIIVTSDHGESFGEHGLMIHSPAVYEELIKVPLIIKYPKSSKQSGKTSTPVSLVDIMPEVLSVLGLEIPPGVQGTRISQKQKNTVMAERFRDKNWRWTCYPFAQRSLQALYKGDYKYIHSSDYNHELYNLREDPVEQKNLIASHPEIASDMQRDIRLWLQTKPSDLPDKKGDGISRELKEVLKEMGYLID